MLLVVNNLASSKKKVAEIIQSTKPRGKRELSEIDSKKLLAAWEIPVNLTKLAKSLNDAIRAAREIHYPLVMKIASPDILHKSEAKGVVVGIGSELELMQAYKDLMNNARAYKQDAEIIGVTVQEYLPPAREIIIGALQDPSFGATVMFGLGGVLVEVLKDISFRLAPLSLEEAREMILDIKGYPILSGLRGNPPADIDAVADLIRRVGNLTHEFPEIKELDMNPVFVLNAGKGVVAVDARIVIGEVK